jgi:hypothetical protein
VGGEDSEKILTLLLLDPKGRRSVFSISSIFFQPSGKRIGLFSSPLAGVSCICLLPVFLSGKETPKNPVPQIPPRIVSFRQSPFDFVKLFQGIILGQNGSFFEVGPINVGKGAVHEPALGRNALFYWGIGVLAC